MGNNNTQIIALHGFLGSPKDFKPLQINNLYAAHLNNMPTSSFFDWVNNFDKAIKKPSIIIGYSLGGRLALHALLKSPHKYKAAIIMAAHPGLKFLHERYERLRLDYQKSRWFLEYDFSYALNLWNSQDIFNNSKALSIDKSTVCSKILASMLTNFSLGRQEYLVDKINKLPMPILWLYPYLEEKNIASIKLAHTSSKLVSIKYSHRLLQHEQVIKNYCHNFLNVVLREQT